MTTSTEEKQNSRDWRRIALKAAIFVVPLLTFAYLFGIDLSIPLNDPDMWWHLKTGDYILTEKKLPDTDPFAYTSPKPLSEGQIRGLRVQWFGQVILGLTEKIGGLPGLLMLRNLLIILPMIILYIWLIRKRTSFWVAMVVISLPSLFFSIHLYYAFERPQAFSFLMTLLILISLERLKRESRESAFRASFLILPALMALWANIHAGFIVGNVMVVIYMASEAVTIGVRKFRGSTVPSVRPVFFALCSAAILASFLNPNTYHVFWGYFRGMLGMFIHDVSSIASGKGGGSWVRSVVLEYKPLYYFYVNLDYKWLIFYWVFTGALYALMVVKYIIRRHFDLAEFLVVSFLTLFANMYARGLMFSLAGMPFFVGKSILELKGEGKKFNLSFKGAVAAFLVLTVAFCTYSFKRSSSYFKVGLTNKWVSPWYPIFPAAFVKQTKLKPPMYNYYTWGGYLIWSLYPDYKVFIDGRAIDEYGNKVADAMLKAYPGWQEQFDAYGINFIVIPVVFRESGHIIPLATALVNDDNWKLVFLLANGAVFVRDNPRNKAVIERYGMDKNNIYNEIIDVENIFLATSPYNPTYSMAKAEALVALKRYKEAKAVYSRYPRLARYQLLKLKQMGY